MNFWFLSVWMDEWIIRFVTSYLSDSSVWTIILCQYTTFIEGLWVILLTWFASDQSSQIGSLLFKWSLHRFNVILVSLVRPVWVCGNWTLVVYRLNVCKMLIIVRGLINVRHGCLDLGRFVVVDVFEDVLEGLRTRIEVFKHFVGLFDFPTILSDAIDAI